KNLAGTFHQPIFVLSDTDFLHTLPELYLRDARSEIIKYGIIMDRELFEDLENGHSIDVQDIVRRCATDKARIVSRDEREGDLRRILNFGHTLGHALEKALNYSLSHGQATAAGMLFASWLSHHRSVLSGNDFLRIRNLIQHEGIIPDSFDLPPPDRIAKALSVDKKREGGEIHFVLTPAIGETSVEILAHAQILDAYERYVHECTKGL
ncbi:MAG: 3-dehydroquinate synthase family protein, partial [Desulfomonilia bacterium]|nr:3-dehydroquinate synthase family protein [Desulfomonilia bacterium]